MIANQPIRSWPRAIPPPGNLHDDLEEHDRCRLHGGEIIEDQALISWMQQRGCTVVEIIKSFEYNHPPIPLQILTKVVQYEGHFEFVERLAVREHSKVACFEAAEVLVEFNKETTKAIIKASGLPPEDEPASEPEPEQPIPEPDPEEPLPVPPNLDPGIVAAAFHKLRQRIWGWSKEEGGRPSQHAAPRRHSRKLPVAHPDHYVA
jgi:hypothetical protein